MMLFPFLVANLFAAIDSRIKAIYQRKVAMSTKVPQLMSLSSNWYRVHFSKKADHSVLRSLGIELKPHSFVGHRRYNLFLNSSQISELVQLGFAKVGRIEDKIFFNGLSYEEADLIYIETSDTFDSLSVPFAMVRYSSSKYSVSGDDIARKAQLLSTIPEVLSIFLTKRPALLNRLAAGYSQQNTRILNSEASFERVFEGHDITGAGVVITLIDTYLDTNSTFFYDPNHDVANGVYNPEHRKVVYNTWHEEMEIENGEHGTHTSGTIAGQAICSNCSISAYNGVAPNAKLAFVGWLTDEESLMYADILVSVMENTSSRITSNSWGWFDYEPFVANEGDEAMFENPDKLFIFGAGNEGDYGFATIRLPAEGKNIVAIGALSQLQIDNESLKTLPSHPYSIQTLFFDYLISWAYLLPGSVTPRLLSYSYYTALYNSIDFEEDLSWRFVYVKSIDDVNILMKKNVSVRPYAALTNITFECVNVSFPVLQIINAAFWEYTTVTDFNPLEVLVLTEQYRPDYGPIELAYYSSLGPAFSGIMKPDLVAPGTNIYSARSIVESYPNHDASEPPDLQVMDGTSMSCPNAAGTAALVLEYIRKYYNIEPSSYLLKAVLVSVADPINPINGFPGYNPNLEFGFGQLNLANLPLESEFTFFICDSVLIANEHHLVTNVTVKSNSTRDLRIVISYLDVTVSDEIPFPLFLEFRLEVVSPNKTLYKGNQYPHGDEEHFSTTQRVLVPVNELEVGNYEIHVIAHLGSDERFHEFGIAVSGDLESGHLEFTNTSECIGGCGEGKCSLFGVCNCSSTTFVGEHCQNEIKEIDADALNEAIEIPPHGNAYFAFKRNVNVPGDFTLFIDMDEGMYLHAFISDGYPPTMPRDYAMIIIEDQNWNMTLTEADDFDSVIGVLLRNDSPMLASYSVYSYFEPTTPTSETTSLTSEPTTPTSEPMSLISEPTNLTSEPTSLAFESNPFLSDIPPPAKNDKSTIKVIVGVVVGLAVIIIGVIVTIMIIKRKNTGSKQSPGLVDET